MLRLLCLCLVSLCCVFAIQADDKKQFDAKKLEGKWTFVSGMKNGNEPGEDMKKAEFEVTKDSITLNSMGQVFKFKYTLDTKASPVTIDMEMTESPFGAGMKAKGIVSCEGDEFKLCYMPMGDDRPKKFDGKEAHLFVMKRKK